MPSHPTNPFFHIGRGECRHDLSAWDDFKPVDFLEQACKIQLARKELKKENDAAEAKAKAKQGEQK
jgi:hypothetical protein